MKGSAAAPPMVRVAGGIARRAPIRHVRKRAPLLHRRLPEAGENRRQLVELDDAAGRLVLIALHGTRSRCLSYPGCVLCGSANCRHSSSLSAYLEERFQADHLPEHAPNLQSVRLLMCFESLSGPVLRSCASVLHKTDEQLWNGVAKNMCVGRPRAAQVSTARV